MKNRSEDRPAESERCDNEWRRRIVSQKIVKIKHRSYQHHFERQEDVISSALPRYGWLISQEGFRRLRKNPTACPEKRVREKHKDEREGKERKNEFCP